MKIIITYVDGRFRAEFVDVNGEQVDICLATYLTPQRLIERICESHTWFENMQDHEEN